MAGTIAADILTHSSSGSVSTEYVVKGSAKVWVNFDGTAASEASLVRDSFSVSTMTDNSTGNYDINLSNAMSDTNQVTCVSNAHQAPISSLRNTHIQSILETASLVNVNNWDSQLRDIAFNQVVVHGDLA
jgi:hypothetical protein